MLGKRYAVAIVAACALTAGCGTSLDGTATGSVTPVDTVERRAPDPEVTTVVAISLDGLNPAAITRLGADRAPVLNRLIDEGASTLNARTEREQTNTLPNHTGMVTSRRIAKASGGHGVTWNDERLEPNTVQAAAGHPVQSVFSIIDSPERDTALFASKEKFSLFKRSWPDAVDRYAIRADNDRLVKLVRRDIADHARSFRFVHLSGPDVAGHARGFMSEKYLDAVAATDARVGRIIDRIEAHGDLADHTVVIVTADHGGKGVSHRDETKLYNYRIPFIVWGATVARGTDLYDLNPDYGDPGMARVTYADEKQPVRNGDVANLATDLLGLPALDGSEHDAGQDLDWH